MNTIMKYFKTKFKEDLVAVVCLTLLMLAVFEMACDDARPLIAGLYLSFAFLIVFVECNGIEEVFMNGKPKYKGHRPGERE